MSLTSAVASVVDVTWSADTDWTIVSPTATYTSGDITILMDKSGGQTAPTVNPTAKDARCYALGTVTVTSATTKIQQLVFTLSAQAKKRMADVTASVGTVAIDMEAMTLTWTGEAQEVVLTVGDKAVNGSESANAGQFCYASLQATLAEAAGVVIPAPTIEGETFFEGSTEVTITGEDGTTIYYTLDDSEPTTASPLTGASPLTFTLDKSATVKAIAVKGADASSVTSKQFTAVTFTEATIADLNSKTEDEANILLSLNDAQVVFVDGNTLHVREGDYALMFYNTGLNLNLGDKLTGSVKVDYDNYYGIHEVKANAFTVADEITVTPDTEKPAPVFTTVADLNALTHIADYVEIGKVQIVAEGTKYFALQGENKIELRKGLSVADYANDGKEYYIAGVFNNIYKGAANLQPAEVSEVSITGISNIEALPAEKQEIYSIDGRRLTKAVKGVNIINGKKVVLK